MALVASSGVTPLAAYANGLRNAAIRPGSLTPGADSTPEATSTCVAPVAAMAAWSAGARADVKRQTLRASRPYPKEDF